ncbi:GGDEF domain-containing protein [Trinickia terrae]|uniref:diguanylate cyclase n=1 Tax=Trinickia terrae TaxID=2571161 RepID=A0A4U1I7M1_9BURK|nr:GGDEF domain-containing protein [Trinickia terrae]TKC89408.1 GGDEF domain-containing protein [Trinickia terrae]
MSSQDRSREDRHEVADIRRSKRRSRGRRTRTTDASEDNLSFEDYAAERLWSFLCAQLATALAAYVVMCAGGAWLHGELFTHYALACAAPVLPMGAALALAWLNHHGERSSTAALVFIAVLETGLVINGLHWQHGALIVLPAFVLVPLMFSPVLQRGWDFPLAAALAVAGPLALMGLHSLPADMRFGIALSMFVALSASIVTNVFARRANKKSYRLEHQLRAFADIDDLTQLPRRRRVFELGRRILQRSERQGQPFSVLYIDADHFKSVNDRFGHDAGDRALRLIAHHIQESMRSSDVAGRFGGEEFVALLPNTDQIDAARVAERLRKRIEDIRQFEVTLTISVGVAQHVRGEQIDRVIRRADGALLDAKGGGRNRVVIAGRPAGEEAGAAPAAPASHGTSGSHEPRDAGDEPLPSEWIAD